MIGCLAVLATRPFRHSGESRNPLRPSAGSTRPLNISHINVFRQVRFHRDSRLRSELRLSGTGRCVIPSIILAKARIQECLKGMESADPGNLDSSLRWNDKRLDWLVPWPPGLHEGVAEPVQREFGLHGRHRHVASFLDLGHDEVRAIGRS